MASGRAIAFGSRKAAYTRPKEELFVEAINDEKLDEVKAFIEKGVNLRKEYEFRYGRAPALHLAAAINQKKDVIKFFLEQGHFHIDDETANEGMTALHWGARYTLSRHVVRHLLAVGARPNARDCHGLTALHHAAERNQLGSTLQSLLKNGANVDAQDKNGQTPLMYATQRKSINRPVVLALLDHRANVNRTDKKGRTALHHAVRSKKGDNVSEFAILQLLEHGAYVNLLDKEGWTPLHHAAHRSDTKRTGWLIPLLLENEAKPNLKERHGLTPLHNAAMVATDEIVVNNLCRAGAEINALDKEDYSPLHYAAERNSNVAILEALVKAGAEPNLHNRHYQRTALHLACMQREDELVMLAKVQCLLKAGADPLCMDWDNYRASQYLDIPKRVLTCLRNAEVASEGRRQVHPLGLSSPVGLNPTQASQLVPYQQHEVAVASPLPRPADDTELYRLLANLPRDEYEAFAILDEFFSSNPAQKQSIEKVAQGSQLFLRWRKESRNPGILRTARMFFSGRR